MKLYFVKPPRYRWTFHSPNSSFWPPLAFASMAAVVRSSFPSVSVSILDCPAQQIGWKTLLHTIGTDLPDILCVGEETVSAHEALRLLAHVKDVNPKCITIAGGVHFTNTIEESLASGVIDYIVRNEGEETIRELISLLVDDLRPGVGALRKVSGIAFIDKEEVILTSQRALVDMESLPFPAYDLLPMECYGRGARTHPNLVAVEHSRGCIDSCSYCTLWSLMGDGDGMSVRPVYRTKSPEKTFEEVKFLAKRFNRKTFCWVDPTWNADPQWNREFCDLVLENDFKAVHTAWMRADGIVRDFEIGLLEKQVDIGMRQFMVGIERTDNHELESLNKHNNSVDVTKRAFEILSKYPSVLSVGSHIYGIPEESISTLSKFYKHLRKIDADFNIPIPLTPNPGANITEEIKEFIEIDDHKFYNFVLPICRTRHLTRHQLATWRMIFDAYNDIHDFVTGLLNTGGRRRGAIRSLNKSKLNSILRVTRAVIVESLTGYRMNTNIKPKWYDS